jgi:hypothetical protein
VCVGGEKKKKKKRIIIGQLAKVGYNSCQKPFGKGYRDNYTQVVENGKWGSKNSFFVFFCLSFNLLVWKL